MRLLLDTHAFLWWLLDDSRLTDDARAAIGKRTNLVHVSAASAWEIATKVRSGKLPEAARMAHDMPAEIAAEGFHELAVTVVHAQRAGFLAFGHKDPFDRMLIAQAMVEDLVLVSNEHLFDTVGVTRLW